MKVHSFSEKEKKNLYYYLAGYPAVPDIQPDTGFLAKSVSGVTLDIKYLLLQVGPRTELGEGRCDII